jgi:dipeptidyl aminopeptidase/acylaminoacyl peptidase
MLPARKRQPAGAAVLLTALIAAAACENAASPATQARQQPASAHIGTLESREARLSYQLDLPNRRGAVPAVVIGHGSGEVTKEHCRWLAGGFVERGFATLCYDKRGVGNSTGEYAMVGPQNSERMFDLLAEDMAAGVRFLQSQPGIDRARIGLVGVSQAGWIIPLAATRVRPAFMIVLSGPTVSVGEEIFYSNIVEQTMRPLAVADGELVKFSGRRGYDPRPVLESLEVPGLWLLGDGDRSIPIPATLAILDELSSRGKPFTRVVFPGVGHDLAGAPIWDEINLWLAQTPGF